jgi:uncharacterized YccA/Bax inhibitor family protein
MATAFKSSNPALNDKAFERALETEAGWAAGTQQMGAAHAVGAEPIQAVDAMTLNGTVWATAALLVLVVGGGVFGWSSVDVTSDTVSFPGWILPVALVAFGVAMVTCFKPHAARFTAPVYALLQGAFLGAISGVYDTAYDGIVLQAVSLTIGVFAMMLFLFATRIIKVTDKLRMGIVAATGAILLVYLLNLVLSLFDSSVPFLHENSLLGIGISLVIVAAGAPRTMEWYAAFGLVVTIIWLYLELLRLLGKLQGRD